MTDPDLVPATIYDCSPDAALFLTGDTYPLAASVIVALLSAAVATNPDALAGVRGGTAIAEILAHSEALEEAVQQLRTTAARGGAAAGPAGTGTAAEAAARRWILVASNYRQRLEIGIDLHRRDNAVNAAAAALLLEAVKYLAELREHLIGQA